MSKYSISVVNVIRHYDVTGKRCPEPFVRDAAAWGSFKAQLNTPEASSSGYRVRITASKLNVRAGAGTAFRIATTVSKGEVYTIVGELNGWGKLKSGAGWIKLSYTERIQS